MEKTVCKLFYDDNHEGLLWREFEYEDMPGNGEDIRTLQGATLEQVLNTARVFTRKYDEVRVYDMEYEAYISLKSHYKRPLVCTYYPEEQRDVEIKYGLYTKEDQERDEMDHTDLDAEKWANYWGDYNQCGVRVDY